MSATVDVAVGALPASEASGELVVLLGAKGGCGVSLLTANLGVLSAGELPSCALDLDVGKGDLATYLDVAPGVALGRVLDQLGELDAVLLASALAVHPSGLRVLLQPDGLEHLHRLSSEDVQRLLVVARSAHRVTFVDAGSRVDVASLAAAMVADTVLVVATPDVPALRDARRTLGLLERLAVPAGRVRLVLNKVGRRSMRTAEVETLVGVPVWATLARDEVATGRADAEGSPLAERSPGAAVTRDLRALHDRLRGRPVAARGFRCPGLGGWAAAATVTALAGRI